MTHLVNQGNETLSSVEKELKRSKPNLTQAWKQLNDLKVLLTKLPSLQHTKEYSSVSKEEFLLARSTFEVACFLSILEKDMESFERHFMQLKPLYLDLSNFLSRSSNESLLVGLNFMRLLSQNRIAEFHSELELLQKPIKEDPYVTFAIRLEQCLTEGSYAKLLSLSKSSPNDYFQYFTQILAHTVRKDIADCLETAYRYLSCDDAMEMLSFGSPDEFKKFIEDRAWNIENQQLVFQTTEENENPMDVLNHNELLSLIEQNISYAKELERIV
ncbi:26S proteasome regulatory subunit N12 [Galdieria sulphuraria]|uniref:26S proteasome regulatory subunit N12 n=1 Tax=Galdieria sulphuraria TaxID=130081 RepID=M2W194_GALSU|nr:26S proteasome regulatory subunit N12 [Galdieria sulphuraria]EME29411.1 26S proteasome regulatory subunit N12 [Galdieria sulphuraria]|eukprot:XP_005705931.1 26S proteasome regulatory subunit N12 [Galdieria sulphuraria]